MTRCTEDRLVRRAIAPCIAVAGLLAAGCAPLTERREGAPVAAPELQLVSAGELALPRDCETRGSGIYRTSFRVERDGRVSGVSPAAGPECLRVALADWVATFRYAPPGEAVPTAIDWMAVVSNRGG